MLQAEVVIIGAGLAGLATAWHLRKHRDVLIVDRGEGPGSESSALGVGMVRRLVDDPVERALADRTVRWLAQPGPEFAGLAREQGGALVALAGDPSGLSDAAAHLLAKGVSLSACSGEDLAATPLLAGSPLRAAWRMPEEWQIEPRSLVEALAEGLRRDNVRAQFGARVLGLSIVGGQVRGVSTDRGEIAAESVVLAAGAWCAGLARQAGLQRPLFPLRRTALHFASEQRSPCPWVWIDDIGLYARRTDRGFLVSPCDEAVSFPDTSERSRRDATPEHVALARQKISRWLPALDGAPILEAWSGLRTFAPDRRPVLGPDPEAPGLWWAAGLGGYGASGGFAAGEAVATWLLGGSTPWLPTALVSPTRHHLRRWPIRPDGVASNAILVDGSLPSQLGSAP